MIAYRLHFEKGNLEAARLQKAANSETCESSTQNLPSKSLKTTFVSLSP